MALEGGMNLTVIMTKAFVWEVTREGCFVVINTRLLEFLEKHTISWVEVKWTF